MAALVIPHTGFAKLESKFNKLYADMQPHDEDQPQRILRGRWHSSYQGLRQDER